MKKIFFRIVCLLVCFLMCFGVLASCGDKEQENTGDVTEPVEGELTAFSTVRREDYQGYEFGIMYFKGYDGLEADFEAEALNGEVLNDRVFRKNQMVKETYNIELKLDTMVNAELYQFIRNNSMTGDSPYDVYGISRSGMPLCTEGYFLDVNSLDDIDTTKEWWDQKWVSEMSIHGSLFSLVGDFSIGTLQSVSCLCFNKELFTNNGLEYPYELVEKGEWTYEKMLSYVKGATRDLDDDSKYTVEDFYGITGWGTEAGYTLFYGSGFSFANIDNSGALEISYDQERLTNIYEQVHKLWIVENNYRNETGDVAQHSYPWDIFKDGRSLFVDTTLLKIGMFLSDMESGYGVIPAPKFDADQEDYSSYASYSIPMTCIPVNVADRQRTGNIVEAFCTASYDVVTPDIFEIVTKLQNVTDPESAEMIDIIIRTKMFDAVHWYVISGYHDFSRQMLRASSTNITSYLKGYTRNAPKEVENINKLYLEAKNNR